MRWQGSLGNFNTLVLGHFHLFCVMDWNDKNFVINGTFVTDDEWVQHNLGLDGSCCQVLMSVHPRKGITFYRKVLLE